MDSTEKHGRRVREEFARQAPAMAEAPAFRSPGVLERIARATAATRGDALLDVACGPGILAAHLAADAGSVVGVDLVPEMLERARRECRERGLENARFLEGAAESLPFREAAFDAVVSRLALHHLLDPGAALREMARVTRPGGRVVIADLRGADDHLEAGLHDALETLRDPSHVRVLPGAELRLALEAAGLTLELEEDWKQPRRFDEWIAITGPTQHRPLESVMRALARSGERAGIELRVEDGQLAFSHSWQLVRARKPARA